jgi:hypothetical protein
MKLTSMSGKYMTADNDTKNIKLKSKNKSPDQLLSYSAQGELIIKDKCITQPSGSNNPLYLSDCVGSESQKWDIIGNSIRPESDNQKCVSYDSDDTLISKTCDNSDSQSWQTEQSEDSNDSFKWTDYFGKTVVLVESDDPWYLNKDTTIPMEYLKQQNLQEMYYRTNADYKPGRVLDENSPDLGFGYSYMDRAGQPCQKIEGFNEGQSDSPNVLMILLCIILLIFIYKYFTKK